MSAVRDRLTPKRDAFVAFIEVFAESFADALPDEDVKVLPYRSIDGIYQEFEQEHQARGFRKGDYIGYSQACHVFKTQILGDKMTTKTFLKGMYTDILPTQTHSTSYSIFFFYTYI